MSETAQLCDFTECENTDRHLWPETSPVDAPEEKLFVTSAGGIGINIGGHVIVRPLREWHRLAASQPDREALKEFIVSASFASRAALDSDTIFCEIYTPGYSPAKKGSFGFFVKELRAILSLLSGAGSGADTKSDGGCNCSWGCVEADNCRRKLGPLPDWKQDQSETSRIKPRPSDPSPGPVKPAPIADSSEAGTGGIVAVTQPFEKYPQLAAHIVRLANTPTAFSLNEWNDFLAALNAALSAPVGEPVAWQFMASDDVVLSTTADKRVVKQWEQSGYHVRPLYTHPPAPAVGPDVREALGESSQTLEYLRREARTWGKIFSVNVDHVLDKNRKALSALTRPLGGFVQGSIARKQSTDTEGSSRTETAGGAG